MRPHARHHGAGMACLSAVAATELCYGCVMEPAEEIGSFCLRIVRHGRRSHDGARGGARCGSRRRGARMRHRVGGGSLRDLCSGQVSVLLVKYPLSAAHRRRGAAHHRAGARGASLSHSLSCARCHAPRGFHHHRLQRRRDRGSRLCIVVVAGMITGCAGGVLRDILCTGGAAAVPQRALRQRLAGNRRMSRARMSLTSMSRWWSVG